MLIAQGILIAEASSVPEIVVQPDVKLWVIFVFVAFCIVAGLVSKFLTMKHEQTLKLGEARKGHESNGADVTETSSGPPWWYVLLTICAALVSGFFILMLYGGSDHLGQRATIFIFVAFCVVASLVSKHMKMKHEQVLQQFEMGKFPSAKPKRNSGWRVAWIFLAVAFFGGFAMLFKDFLGLLDASPLVGTVNAVAAVRPAPVVLPESMRDWTEELPFDADQYPGVEECAAPLARMIAKEIRADLATVAKGGETKVEAEAGPEFSASVSILNPNVSGPMNGSWWYGSNFSNFKDAFQKALKSEMPSVLFHSPIGKKYQLRFDFSEIQKFTEVYPEGKTLVLLSGRVKCRSPELENTHSVAFHQKPWLTHFKEFSPMIANGNRFYIGATKKFQPLRSKAHEYAVEEIANRLKLGVGQIEPLIVDKFTQAIERPYGKVFREAILVHNPPVSFDLLAGNVGMASSSSPPILRFDLFRPSFEFLLALIVCLTVVAGFISNIVTQGYYRTKISNSLVVVAVAFVSVILLTVVLGVIV